MSQPPPAPMFSVVMPTYNQALYLPDAAESVLAQTFRDFELILVDDGSTDETPRLLEQLAARDERITVLHQANAGASAARRAGVARARAGWLAYLDSDDLWRPDALATYAEYIAAHPHAQALFGYRDRLNEDGSVTELPPKHQTGPSGTKEIFEHIYISHLCVCYRRDVYEKAGGFDPALRAVEDYDLYLRISLLCDFEPIGRPTGLRRRHSGCLSRASGYTKMLEAEVLRRFVEWGGGGPRLDPGRVRRRLGKLYRSAGKEYFKSRCYRNALEALRAARPYPFSPRGWLVGLFSRILLPLGKSDPRGLPRL